MIRPLLRASLVVALAAAYFGHVFQVFGGAFWQAGLSSWGDPHLINVLLEHWYQSARRFTDPFSPPMFAPVRGTLGYSVGLVLYAPFYAAARTVFDPFQAHTATILLVMATGSLSLYVLLRRIAGVAFVEAVLLTAFFASSRNVTNGLTAVWSQMASVFLIPPIVLLACVAARMPDGPRRQWLAGLSGFLAALLLTQEFYTGLFAISFAGVAGAVWLFVARDPPVGARLVRFWRAGPPLGTRIALAIVALAGAWVLALMLTGGGAFEVGGIRITSHDVWRPGLVGLAVLAAVLYRHGPRDAIDLAGERRWIVAFGAGALAGGALFLWVYLPAFLQFRGFGIEQTLNTLIPFDAARWPSWDAVRAYESQRAVRLALVVGVLAWVPAFGVEPRVRRYCAWFVLLSIVVFLLPVRFGTFSLWQTFFAPIPGFSIVRDPKRIIYAYELLVVLMGALFVARLRARSVLRWLVSALVLGLLVTDWNRETFPLLRPASDYQRWVAAPIAIDASCRSFFVKGASEAYAARMRDPLRLYGVDATFVALAHAIPTLNGYSAWIPEGWRLHDPGGPDYAEAVSDWIARHRLDGVCELDVDRRTMTPYEP